MSSHDFVALSERLRQNLTVFVTIIHIFNLENQKFKFVAQKIHAFLWNALELKAYEWYTFNKREISSSERYVPQSLRKEKIDS